MSTYGEGTPLSHTIEQVSTTEQDNNQRRWRIGRWFGSVALSVLASMGATQQNNSAPEHTGFTTVATMQTRSHEASIGIGLPDILPGDATLRLPGVEIAEQPDDAKDTKSGTPESSQEIVKEQLRVALMEWARLFDKDAMAEKPVAMAQVQKIADTITDLIQNDSEITDIRFIGSASDEDDYAYMYGGENPGLGIDSAKNEALALTRAKAVEKLVTALLRQQLSAEEYEQVIDVMQKPKSIETQDKQLNKDIEQLADTMGIRTVDLVSLYNRNPQELPKDARETLAGLKRDRYVKAIITAKNNVVSEPETGVVNEEEDQPSSIVIVPIIIPFRRRKSSQYPNPKHGTNGVKVSNGESFEDVTATGIGSTKLMAQMAGKSSKTGRIRMGGTTRFMGTRRQRGVSRSGIATGLYGVQKYRGKITPIITTNIESGVTDRPLEDANLPPKDPTASIIPKRQRSKGKETTQHGGRGFRRKQPAQSNNGGNSGPRGQRNFFPRSRYTTRRTRH